MIFVDVHHEGRAVVFRQVGQLLVQHNCFVPSCQSIEGIIRVCRRFNHRFTLPLGRFPGGDRCPLGDPVKPTGKPFGLAYFAAVAGEI